jgi:hypothetical protein
MHAIRLTTKNLHSTAEFAEFDPPPARTRRRCRTALCRAAVIGDRL